MINAQDSTHWYFACEGCGACSELLGSKDAALDAARSHTCSTYTRYVPCEECGVHVCKSGLCSNTECPASPEYVDPFDRAPEPAGPWLAP